MSSRTSSTSSLQWTSLLTELNNGKESQVTTALTEAGIETLSDLIWILPHGVFPIPRPQPFSKLQEKELFVGRGKIIHCQLTPLFYRKFKAKMILHNAYLVIKDEFSDATLAIRFYNIYPSQKKKLETLDLVQFTGVPQIFKSQWQLSNPKIISTIEADSENKNEAYYLNYPTVNKVSGHYIQKLIGKIPLTLWGKLESPLVPTKYLPLKDAFCVYHGLIPITEWSAKKKKEALDRLIYEEFFRDQLKILSRKKFLKSKPAPVFKISNKLSTLLKLLPYSLTEDQLKIISEVSIDFESGHPMMRMLQGDVGCGKTIVAFLLSIMVVSEGSQVAIMCPTESLAIQHFKSFESIFKNLNIKTELLIGSIPAKDKKIIAKNLKSGETSLVIGTHALFQKTIEFKKLSFVVIDEQHKFGVEQRLALTSKGSGVHTLIMSATPIPRTLSLSHYGDLDFSTIKTSPPGRKEIKTRIVSVENYKKYLDFLKMHLDKGEQGYFVFPTISESETLDLLSLEEAQTRYKKELSKYKIEVIHGKQKMDEKEIIINKFKNKEIQILLATSVIEVGIDVPNATFISIYHPERFGLSSLHQLRGRVGRGEKQGFCFLVLDRELNPEALERLEVLEKTTNGFYIAEEDLKRRGEGDLFGVDQSGSETSKRIASPLLHHEILLMAYQDTQEIMTNHPDILMPELRKLAQDQKILDTI